MKMKSKNFLTANSVETANSYCAHVGARPENVFSHLIGSIRNSKLWGGWNMVILARFSRMGRPKKGKTKKQKEKERKAREKEKRLRRKEERANSEKKCCPKRSGFGSKSAVSGKICFEIYDKNPTRCGLCHNTHHRRVAWPSDSAHTFFQRQNLTIFLTKQDKNNTKQGKTNHKQDKTREAEFAAILTTFFLLKKISGVYYP